MKFRNLVALLILLLAAMACTNLSPAQEAPVSPVATDREAPTDAPAAPAEPTETPADPVVEEPTAEPTIVPEPEPVVREPQPALTWLYGCEVALKDYAEWCWLYDGEFTNVAVTSLPANAKVYPDVYDFHPGTNQVLIGLSDWVGAGPANMSSTDLWLGKNPLELELQPLIYDAVVSAALFSPDGTRIAYMLATASTYELHLLDLGSGSDVVLAADVSPDFLFSPDGTMIAFIRDASWTLVGEGKGLYVVSTVDGTETSVSLDMNDVIEIRSPLAWTPDSETLVVMIRYANSGDPTWELGVVRLADGTRSAITVSAEAAANYPADMLDLNLMTPLVWAEDGSYFLGNAITGFMTADMAFWVLKYNLEPALGAITSIDVVAEQAEFIGWDVPGESVWVRPSIRSDQALPYSAALP